MVIEVAEMYVLQQLVLSFKFQQSNPIINF